MTTAPLLDRWEIPNISSMKSSERRNFVEFRVPGRRGSLFQDLNTDPIAIEIVGSLYGDEARDTFLDEVRKKYAAGEAVPFAADILTATDIQYVLIERLEFAAGAADPEVTRYRILLRESPSPPQASIPGIDDGLLDEAKRMVDSAASAIGVIEALGSIPDFGDPSPPLTGALEGVSAATGGLGDALKCLTALFGPSAEE